MESYKLVLPEYLNQFGFLFGGHLLRWVDEQAWIAASLDYPGSQFVTVAMDRVEFHKTVREGAILRFHIQRFREGVTSTRYLVQVYRANPEPGADPGETIFSTCVTLVRVDLTGRKLPLRSESNGGQKKTSPDDLSRLG